MPCMKNLPKFTDSGFKTKQSMLMIKYYNRSHFIRMDHLSVMNEGLLEIRKKRATLLKGTAVTSIGTEGNIRNFMEKKFSGG